MLKEKVRRGDAWLAKGFGFRAWGVGFRVLGLGFCFGFMD